MRITLLTFYQTSSLKNVRAVALVFVTQPSKTDRHTSSESCIIIYDLNGVKSRNPAFLLHWVRVILMDYSLTGDYHHICNHFHLQHTLFVLQKSLRMLPSSYVGREGTYLDQDLLQRDASVTFVQYNSFVAAYEPSEPVHDEGRIVG